MIESKFCFLREQSGEWYEFRSRRFEMKPGEGKTFISYLALLCYESFNVFIMRLNLNSFISYLALLCYES